jgi:crotonobetainyl-CoA:carnitine CoA-transferase CaiB-like acyl-CoA transferase
MLRRLELPDDLDDYIQRLVAERPAGELTAALQAAGIAAYPVQSCLDLHSDENLLANEFWQWLDQNDAGPMPYDGLSYRLERTGSHQTAAPSIGQDTDEVLGELLAMTPEDTALLRDTGVIG